MARPGAQTVIAGTLLLATAALAWVLTERSSSRFIEAGFWFEPVTYESSRLGGALTEAEIHAIEAEAASELGRAFAGLRITFGDRRNAMYAVRVVQAVRDLRFERTIGVSGESRSVAGFGGKGALSFDFLAAFAVRYAPPDADRATIVTAIGRGVGRSAAHEFAHLLLGSANIHATSDIMSYEYESADRREQYYGEMRWDIAWPLLQRRVGE